MLADPDLVEAQPIGQDDRLQVFLRHGVIVALRGGAAAS
jgi:hypothetical protein